MVIFCKRHGQTTRSGSTAFADQVEGGDHLQVLSSGEVRWEVGKESNQFVFRLSTLELGF